MILLPFNIDPWCAFLDFQIESSGVDALKFVVLHSRFFLVRPHSSCFGDLGMYYYVQLEAVSLRTS